MKTKKQTHTAVKLRIKKKKNNYTLPSGSRVAATESMPVIIIAHCWDWEHVR